MIKTVVCCNGMPQFCSEEVFSLIVDLHTHIFPDKIAASAITKLQQTGGTCPCTDGTRAGLQSSMAQAGIDLSVVLPVATGAGQVVHVNDASARINEQTRQTGVLSLGCMHPDYGDYKTELCRIREMGFKGIKLHPAYQNVNFDDIRYLRIIEEASALGLVVVTHAGIDIGLPQPNRCTPDQILQVLKQVEPDKLVLAHMGGWKMWDEVEDKLVGAPVWLDTSYSLGRVRTLPGRHEGLQLMAAEQFIRIVRKHGTDRILFGTDSPWGDQSEGAQNIKELCLTDEETEAILGGNAKNLLGL